MQSSKRVAIYLAGNIKKCHEIDGDEYWGLSELENIQKIISPHTVDFLHPGMRNDDLSDQLSVFGRDMTQVYCSNVVFVDARHRRGLGVGAEMMWAVMNGIPVVTLCPPESHYRKSSALILDVPVNNWVHPFIEGLSSKVVGSIKEGAQWIKDCIIEQSIECSVKDATFIKQAMKYYQQTQFAHDEPMQTIGKVNEFVLKKLGS